MAGRSWMQEAENRSQWRAIGEAYVQVVSDSDVDGIQAECSRLGASYAGDKAAEITRRARDVADAWAALSAACAARRAKLEDADDLYRFLNQVRTLALWMDDVVRQMNTGEKPRDVSGVELLMNNHQSLKAEIGVHP